MPAARRVRVSAGVPLLAIALLASILCGCSGGRSRSSGRPATTSTTAAARHRRGSRVTSPGQRTNARPLAQLFEPSLPVARQEGTAAVAGGRLYVIGGYDSSRNSTRDVFVFYAGRWHSGPPLPIPLNHPAAAGLSGRVYVAGGFTTGGATGRAFVLKPHASAWREIAPLHRARGALVLVALRRHLYAIGGRDGSVEIGTPEVYDVQADTWADLPSMPEARNHLAGFAEATKVCAAGGRTPIASTRIDCFDPAKRRWVSSATLPTATSGAGAAVIRGTTVVAGGESTGETSLIDSVQMLDAGKWMTMPMLVPRHGTAFARYDRRLWLCGGATAPGYAAVATCTSIGT